MLSKVTKERFNNHEVYRLENKHLVIWVDPSDGMNIFRLCYKGQELIHFDKERYEKGVTYGTPILYPTPNRVEQGIFEFEGQTYTGKMHGVVRKEVFTGVNIQNSENAVAIQGELHFQKDTPLYEAFPFESSLKIKISLRDNELIYNYEVVNQDTKALPYGFALHPFFYKNGQEVSIKVFAKQVMRMNEEKLLTGELIQTKHTPYALEEKVSVNTLELDHVYTDITTMPMAEIHYDEFVMQLSTSNEFSHVVVYTPNAPYFCIENQTCSTDAHNLYTRGYHKESGLEIVESGTSKKGEIRWVFNDL